MLDRLGNAKTESIGQTVKRDTIGADDLLVSVGASDQVDRAARVLDELERHSVLMVDQHTDSPLGRRTGLGARRRSATDDS